LILFFFGVVDVDVDDVDVDGLTEKDDMDSSEFEEDTNTPSLLRLFKLLVVLFLEGVEEGFEESDVEGVEEDPKSLEKKESFLGVFPSPSLISCCSSSS
tara:strand:- start:44 stop:340 length:297 start_codon:yes stop_codon:yes gene_type:complete